MSVVLSEHLPLLAVAPDGIQKLRGLILELAVRGKLVPQDPNDEPASELLKRIAQERAQLEAKGAYKKSKAMPIEESESPVSVSATSWGCAPLGDVVEIVRGITFPSSEKSKTPENGRVRCLRTANVQDKIEWGDILYIRSEFIARDDQMLRPNDIVMSMANSRELVGKVALVECELDEPATFGGFLGVLRPHLILPKFVMSFLRAPTVRSSLIDSASQTTNIANISLAKLRPLSFPIPPLAEQHRIVAKVDELMALCDRLEAEQADAESAHAKLVDTLLGTLTQSADAADLAANWQRLAEYFDTLFTTESSLDALKQTILQLAVMGKLVAQDPTDEPTSELLKRIAQERARLEAEGVCKKSKPVPPVQDDEQPFTIPKTWSWTRLGALTELITKGSSPKWQGIEYVTSDEGVLFITSENVGNYVLRKLDALKFVDRRFNEIEPRSILQYGDILINLVGASIGRTARFDLKDVANINQAVALVRLIKAENIDATYLLHFLNSDFAINHMLASQVVNAQPNISLTDVRDFPVPCPPLAEQRRIVAKVDELMALCDRIKADLVESRHRQERLASTLIESALNAA